MRPRTWRSLFAAGALLAALLTPVVTAGPASAGPVSSCSTSSGVLVVVDFRHFGTSLTRGCASAPSSGFAALHDAGYTTDGTVHDGDGFVCRIDGHPNKSQDACYNTPPATAYWSYWHANAGQSRWSYSSLGAQNYRPEAGSVDAWVFGSTDVGGTSGGPSFTPAEARGQRSGADAGSAASSSARPRSSSAAGRTTAHATSGPGRSTSAHAPTSITGRSSAASTTASSSAGSSTAAASPSASTFGTNGSSAATPSFADASSVAEKSSSGGSALPVILGVALVLLLGAGGGWGVLRRRRADSAEH